MREVMEEEIHVGKNPLSIAASTIYAEHVKLGMRMIELK